MHPEDDDYSEKISENVDPGVHFEGERLSVQLSDQVEDPGLVEHGVKLGDEAEHAEALTHPGVDDPADGGDGPDVVDSEE